MGKSAFVVVDGMDGSGKSEIVKMLHNYLFSKKQYRILTTREPTNGAYGKRIRRMLRNENNPMSNKELLLNLFAKDREEHLKNTIIPFLKSAKDECHIVICDRYYYSSIAFQHAQGIPIEKVINKNKNFLKPDIAFILDVNPAIALKRISNREKEKFEKLNFMKKLRWNFLNLKGELKDNIKVVDASRPLDEIFGGIVKEIENLLTKA